MKVLRLGNSDDLDPRVPDDQKNWYVVGKVLEEAIGEPVETVVKAIYPGEELPTKVAEWMDKYQPDLVFLKVTWVWYGYESVPRRIERIFGRAGRPIARAGLKASRQQKYVSKWWFKAGRRVAHRVIGGDTQWPTDQVLRDMEATIRKVVARENIALVVKGTGGGRRNEGPLTGQYGRFAQRRSYVEGNIGKLCNELHVPYVGTGPRKPDEQRDLKGGDGIHPGATGHYWMGRQEGLALVEGWKAYGGKVIEAGSATDQVIVSR